MGDVSTLSRLADKRFAARCDLGKMLEPLPRGEGEILAIFASDIGSGRLKCRSSTSRESTLRAHV
jgi:hypothetical protein